MQPSGFFTREQKERIKEIIHTAESGTSAEIRIYLERICLGEPTDRAAYLFEKLGMHKTSLRNGVLFYISYEDHKLAILGDAGINARVPENFWDQVMNIMINKFRESDYAGGLEAGILEAGVRLKEHFPRRSDDVNELPDDIALGEN